MTSQNRDRPATCELESWPGKRVADLQRCPRGPGRPRGTTRTAPTRPKVRFERDSILPTARSYRNTALDVVFQPRPQGSDSYTRPDRQDIHLNIPLPTVVTPAIDRWPSPTDCEKFKRISNAQNPKSSQGILGKRRRRRMDCFAVLFFSLCFAGSIGTYAWLNYRSKFWTVDADQQQYRLPLWVHIVASVSFVLELISIIAFCTRWRYG